MANPSRSASPRPPTPLAPDAQAWQASVLDELRAIRALLERRQPGEPDEAAAGLLAAIYATVRDRAFVAAELLEHAALPDAKPLQEAIVAAVGSCNAKRLGKALKRIAGRQLGDHSVERVGQERDGALWVVRASLRE